MIIHLLRFAPKRALTQAIGKAARLRVPRGLRQRFYGAFARRVGANLSEADRALDEYPSFQDFFSRRLRPGLRPVAPSPVVSPVDGTIVTSGKIERGNLLQVKGRSYNLAQLIEDQQAAAELEGGSYVTIYLHPRNYHRIHSPVDGVVTASRPIAGRLFPVNAQAVQRVERLFATNERLVTIIEADFGRVVLVKVAAFGVGTVQSFCHAGQKVRRGEEIATFLMGSTVVLIAPPNITLRQLDPDSPIWLGEALTATDHRAKSEVPTASA